MATYQCLYMDGSNGLRRGDLIVLDLAAHPYVENENGESVRVFERNPGEGIFDTKDGGTWYVEVSK